MNHLVNDAGQYLPSLAKYIDRCCADLGRGGSVISVLNDTADAALIWDGCNRKLRDVGAVEVTEFGEQTQPLQVLLQALNVQWPNSHDNRSLETLLLKCDLQEVIAIQGLDHVSDGSRRIWLNFFARWADASQARRASGLQPSSLWTVLTLRSAEVIPARDVWLSNYWWWAVPSALEVQMICRGREESEDGRQSREAVWREMLIPPLVGGDLDLIDVLWESVLDNKQAIFDQLTGVAQERSWTQSILEKLGVADYARRMSLNVRRSIGDLNKDEREYWRLGLLTFTPEYGLQISSAALAAFGEWKQIEHRYWHGQAALLLPKIDEFRLAICQALTQKHGKDWPLWGHEPVSEYERLAIEESPLATEWGHLENQIKTCKDLRIENHRLRAISTARSIRNQLSHYKPINFHDYCQIAPHLS